VGCDVCDDQEVRFGEKNILEWYGIAIPDNVCVDCFDNTLEDHSLTYMCDQCMHSATNITKKVQRHATLNAFVQWKVRTEKRLWAPGGKRFRVHASVCEAAAAMLP
jgi:hypothetical protein